MKQIIQTKHLLNLNETCAAPLLEQFEYPILLYLLEKHFLRTNMNKRKNMFGLHGPLLYSLQLILQVQPS